MLRRYVKTVVYVVILAALAAAFLFLLHINRGDASGEPVVIAVPYSGAVQDYETNYYTRWLEEKTGYDIRFVFLDEGYERESINVMLAAKESGADGIFLPEKQEILSAEEYQAYIREGYLTAPQELLAPESNLRRVQELYPNIDFTKLLGEDGKLYCFPSLNMARTGQNRQIMWINIDWLTGLGLTMPRTTEEFEEVLRAFKDRDPNGNGLADELALVSCEADDTLSSYRFLLNAFTYYDGTLPGDGSGADGQGQSALREGIAFCASLYEQGLLAGDCFSYTRKQFMELVNDPADTVGAFASHSIADVVYSNNPGILAHFVQLAPLASPSLEQGYAVRTDILPAIGGLIPANAAAKEAAAQIMDVMLSDEAALIALYGEEGVDWRFSRNGELSTYGTRARVTTIRYLKGERQNKNYAGMGPLVAAAEFTDGVTWNGDHSMTEYIDARAVKAYEPYYRSGADKTGAWDSSRRSRVCAFLDAELLSFLTGEKDAGDDEVWAVFLAEYRRQSGT